MSGADDIAVSLIKEARAQLREAKDQLAAVEQKLEAHTERLLGRWLLKIGVGAIGTIVFAIAVATWTVRGTLDDVRLALVGDRQQIESHAKQIDKIPNIEHQATDAQKSADIANAWIAGHSAAPTPEKKK